ncbi:PBECR2 nuclease fold domain-containing protein [Accumulibacter sp.]|uniref:PBECR2 nuclease fold domain-containing protein n=1 Tax=Accumulibacter sp. TaxID=2053492 RepID=UPI0025DBCF54|nr:PBECR2 nuclease fold domain-containing protein [Accumulibacter sp.]MCM8596464.1 PBECR2 nuclease fold domain-containing protein [Accumulibacter sp.]MCM8627364.1 PBECR2 nuclease fold domain-containing protein [Accumulibacter sp.]MDS4050613.1 PBECR2 nuclease fold domain-containing protein [Accumulibacter sp.]
MGLMAETIKTPDDIWLRWEESREQPGAWQLKRRYIKGFLVEGDNGPRYAVSVFEHGKDGWRGSTAMVAQPARSPEARQRYIEQQRDGFLLYQK